MTRSQDPPTIADDPALATGNTPILLLNALRKQEQTWVNIAPRHGVTNPDPPWKVSLYATLECLSARATLPSLDRRHIEDRLSETVYREIAGPERQLLTLAHILLSHGLLSERDLSERVHAVRLRLEAS